MENNNLGLICSYCEAEIKDDFEFCPDCGELLIDDIFCTNHPDKEAAGVCLICESPFCSKCGKKTDSRFLCSEHDKYEIVEGFVRVFGSSDPLQTDYIIDCLIKNGLHPQKFNRKVSPISLGGPDYTLFRSSGEYDGHIINEIKVMVPCCEVLEAEKIIEELKE